MICNSYFWVISYFIGCELKHASKWNMFVMIINILYNKNIVALSIFTKSSYDNWWKHDGFGHDVTSIGLGYQPIYKWTPHYGGRGRRVVKTMYLTMYLQVTQVLICGILVDSVVSTYLTSQSKPITIKKNNK